MVASGFSIGDRQQVTLTGGVDNPEVAVYHVREDQGDLLLYGFDGQPVPLADVSHLTYLDTANAPYVIYDNVQLDLNRFYGGFAGPLLNNVKETFEPIDWLIDPDHGWLNQIDPIMSFLRGKDSTVLETFTTLLPVVGTLVIEPFFDAISTLYGLADDLAEPGNDASAVLDLGALQLPDVRGLVSISSVLAFLNTGISEVSPSLSAPDALSLSKDFEEKDGNTTKKKTRGVNFLSPSISLTSQQETLQKKGTIGGKKAELTTSRSKGVSLSEGFDMDFALLSDPQRAMELLVGGNVDLFTLDLPRLTLDITFGASFSILTTPPISVGFSGSLAISVDFAFGFDTQGYKDFISSGDPNDIGNGWFILDTREIEQSDLSEGGLTLHDPADATLFITDPAELTLSASIGLELAFGKSDIIAVGIGGGITGSVDFNFYDPNGDGRVRGDELSESIKTGSVDSFGVDIVDPLLAFDISASLTWSAYIFVDVLGARLVEWDPFAAAGIDQTIFSYTFPQERTPVLATKLNDGTLRLNMGPYASRRLFVDTEDDGESFYVSMSGTTVVVEADGLGDLPRQTRTYSGVTRIEAWGGEGNDTIEIDSSVTVPVEMEGGEGNDTLQGGSGDDTIRGGSGNDTIEGGAGADRIEGEDGDDTLYGLTANASTGSSDGQNVILGGSGDDDITGGSANDEIDGGEGIDGFVRGFDGSTFVFNALWGEVDVTESANSGGRDIWDFRNVFTALTITIDANLVTVEDQMGNIATYAGSVADLQMLQGGQGSDTFIVNAIPEEGLTLDGCNGNDYYVINMDGALDGALTISDSGFAWNVDTVVVNGTDYADVTGITEDEIRLFAPVSAVIGIGPDSGLEVANVNHQSGDDTGYIYSVRDDMTVIVRGDAGDDTIQLGTGAAITPTSPLENIGNGGTPADTYNAAGSTDFTIVWDDDSTTNIDIDPASTTVQDLLDAVNDTLDTKFSTTGATYLDINSDGNGFVLTATGLAELRASTSGDSSALTHLGFSDGHQASGGTIQGSAVYSNALGGVVDLLGGNSYTGLITVEGGSEGSNDTLIVDDSGDTTSNTGELTPSEITGLGMSQGVDYSAFEIVDVRLGGGDDAMTVDQTEEKAITAIHGGPGADTLQVTKLLSTDGPLVLYGDTAASQSFTGTGTGTSGNDTLDASVAARSVVLYGGGGDDTVTGGSETDLIAGGGDHDTLTANAGNDQIYGDSGVDVNLTNRTFSVVTSGMPGEDDFDTSGDDTIEAMSGNHIILADHGQITQADLIEDLGTDQPSQVATINPSIGGNDTVTTGDGDDLILGGAGAEVSLDAGDGNNIVLGDNGSIDLSTTGLPTNVETSDPSDGGADVIATGTGNDLVLGGAAGDIINAGDGDNVVIGDHGFITQLDGDLTEIKSTDFGVGGADVINTGSGDDIAIGGDGQDELHVSDGNDTVFGDHGHITFDDANPPNPTLIETLEPTYGDVDTITSGVGNDLVLGGAAGDIINAGDGDNVVIGDHGFITQLDGDLTEIKSTDFGVGGADVINTGSGDDIAIGGDGQDELHVSDGNDTVFGDHGHITFDDANPPNPTLIETLEPTYGDVDTITSGVGNDLVLGGAAGDIINAGDGDNVVIGDHGFITQLDGDLTEIKSTDFGVGGADVINTGSGGDIAIGGDGQDELHVSDGNDTVFGDHGHVTFDDANPPNPTLIETLEPTYGDVDTITSGTGNDLVMGGAAGDDINTGDGDNVVLGDHGAITQIDGDLDEITSTDFGHGGADIVNTGSGDDIAIGGDGQDELHVSDGNDTVFGDHGHVTYDAANPPNPTLVETLEPTYGDVDTVTSGIGNDLVLGGAAGDIINAGDGDNVVIGDHGFITQLDGDLTEIKSTDFGVGGSDVINTGSGDDIAIGGDGQDELHVSDGNNIVFGDHGHITFDAANPPNPTLIETLEPTYGDVDTITSGVGNDLVLGGAAGDDINAGDGDNVVIGDHGFITLLNGALTEIRSTDFGEGGDDVVQVGDGNDVLVGGFGQDELHAGDDDNIVLGDHGDILFTAGVLNYITTLAPEIGDADTVTTGDGQDVIFGGAGPDSFTSLDGHDILAGDHGFLATGDTGGLADITVVSTSDPTLGDSDVIDSGDGNDLVFGGTLGDQIFVGTGNDMAFGDHGRVFGDVDLSRLPMDFENHPFDFESIDILTSDLGGPEFIDGGAGNDILLGQQDADTVIGGSGDDDIFGGHNQAGGHDTGDRLDGQAGVDVIIGDNGSILRNGRSLSPRIRILSGETIYDQNDEPQVTLESQPNPRSESERSITLYDHADDTDTLFFGDDEIAGGPEDDTIFGQLGDDTIQGDSYLEITTPVVVPPPAVPHDGDDYIEGNGGQDLIYGNLGRDDIVGGSSSLFDGLGT